MIRKLTFTRKTYPQFIFSIKKSTKSGKWQSVVGLEVHAQISTNSKLFSGSKTVFGAPLNSCVSLFDASIPGTLPILNKKCVEAGIKTALALGCRINPISMFDRKHYFYADLPAGYQITQQRAALANCGELSFPVYIPGVTKKPYKKTVRLTQLQLEQDSGKSIHDDLAGRSLVDLNRAGAPLMELVFEPDLENGEEAASLIKELILILKRLGTCNCRMEEGSLRVDANISINREGEPLGTRTEVKNIGSVRNVAQAVSFEISRQIDIKNNGGLINNETRSWDAITKKTIPMRDKEVQQDYRFMPEPNLPPLHINLAESTTDDTNLIQVYTIKQLLPELPEETRQNLIKNFGLAQENAIILVNEPILLEYFYKITEFNKNTPTKNVANFLINNLLNLCNQNNINIEECQITSQHLIDLISLMQDDTINLQISRLILQELYINPKSSVSQIIAEKNLSQINNFEEIEKLCVECINKNPKAVQQYKNGKKKVLFAIAGDVAKLSNQRANMAKVIKKLEDLLYFKFSIKYFDLVTYLELDGNETHLQAELNN